MGDIYIKRYCSALVVLMVKKKENAEKIKTNINGWNG
jgi:hypothetical protein